MMTTDQFAQRLPKWRPNHLFASLLTAATVAVSHSAIAPFCRAEAQNAASNVVPNVVQNAAVATTLTTTQSITNASTSVSEQALKQKATAAANRGVAFLRQSQNEDGAWSPHYGPAITGLITAALLDRPNIDATDPMVAKAITYILSFAKEDGGIHSGMLHSYNTAICVSALARVEDHPEAKAAVDAGIHYLKSIQWVDQDDPHGTKITPEHPYYGGIGYGKHGRPDMSNLKFMLQAFEDAGVDCHDPAVQRAVVFLTRCQAVEQNDMFDATVIPRDGGFIYSTTINQSVIGTPESKANQDQIDEGKKGLPVSGLRTYGSITYAGFKSYLYAELASDDPRVTALLDWVSHNYTLTENPGMPEAVKYQGHYYYLATFSRALDAWGQQVITDHTGAQHNWAHDLMQQLIDTQKPDGSWSNIAKRWLETDPNLVTSYALTALNAAID